MNKREIMFRLLDSRTTTSYIPAAFFLHFGKDYQRGKAAIDKHLEYFQYTGMDFVKIQYELSFPPQPEIQRPSDWARLKLPAEDFYQDQWDITTGLVKAAGKDALVLMTLYSPFMCAGQIVDKELLTEHIQLEPEAVKAGLALITESLMTFVKGCIQRGIDGFYHSTQGAETFRFEGSPLFKECIKPYDLILMQEIHQSTEFNILHICDYHGGYSDLSDFLDYPGDVVNCSLSLGNRKISPKEISQMFNRPFMGGLDRKGAIATGGNQEIKRAVEATLQDRPAKFILGADCTVPSDTDWDHLRTAISLAHQK